MKIVSLRVGVKILSQLCVISMIAGMAAGALYVVPSKMALLVTAVGLFLFEFHTGSSKSASSVHFSAAVAAFFILFYCILFGFERPSHAKFMSFALLTSAIWMIGRAGFLCGRMVLKKRLRAQAARQKDSSDQPAEKR